MLQNFNILVWVYCWQYKNENYDVKAFIGKWKNKWTVCDITHKGKASVLTIVWMFLQKRRQYVRYTMEMKILMAANIMDGKWQFVHWKFR